MLGNGRPVVHEGRVGGDEDGGLDPLPLPLANLVHDFSKYPAGRTMLPREQVGESHESPVGAVPRPDSDRILA